MRFSNNLKNKIYSDTLKTSAGMYGTPGSQFFRITTGTQPRPNAFDELRSAMTFLSKFRVTGTSSSFRLNLKGKAGKEIPEPSRFELSQKLSVKFLFYRMQKKTSQDH